jgi:hypothetical protein
MRRMRRFAPSLIFLALTLFGSVAVAQADPADDPAPVVAPAPAAAPPSYDVSLPIETGVEHVRQEVEGIQALGGSRIPLEQVAAQSALTWVQSQLSPAIAALVGGSTDLTTAFRLQAGLCGQIVESFMQILQRVGVRVLPVQFFYVLGGERQSHVAAQVWWRGHWHYVDPTWGVLFEKHDTVLGPEDVLKLSNPDRYALMNRLVPWTDANVRRGGGWSPLGYLTAAKDRQVVMNGAGTVAPPRSSPAKVTDASAPLVTPPALATWSLSLMPDYVGSYAPYARQLVTITQRLTLPKGARTLVIGVRGKLCGGIGTLHVGPVAVPWDEVPDNADLRVPLPRGLSTITLTTGGGDPSQACAVLLTSLSAQ